MKESTLNKIDYKSPAAVSVLLKVAPIFLLLCMAGCKAKKLLIAKPVKTDTVVKVPDTKAAKLSAIRSAQNNFDTFSGKARTRLDLGGSSNDVTLNIRIKQDRKIWISVTAIAGIEVARVLITPDSLQLISRLQSLYLKKPFSYINKFAGNQVNYKTIESLLVGNAVPELLNENADLKTSPDNITISGRLDSLVYTLVTGQGMKVTRTSLDDHSAGQSLEVVNSALVQVGPMVMPSQIDITSIVKDKKIQVNLRYTKSDFNQPQEFPFSIPARYKEME